jgi:hypothetical protein
MSEMNHTPTPWVAKGQQVFDQTEHAVSLAYCGIVAGAGVCKDGKIRSFGVDEETAIANAAIIVRAVNAHDILVRALVWMRDNCGAAPLNIRRVADDALKSSGLPDDRSPVEAKPEVR